MTFDHNFGYSFPPFSSLLKKSEEEKENELAIIVFKSHAFQPGLFELFPTVETTTMIIPCTFLTITSKNWIRLEFKKPDAKQSIFEDFLVNSKESIFF